MSDFLESAKQKVGQALNRASWETEKRLRINSKQGQLNSMKHEREEVVEALSSAVLLLYRQGRLTDPQLRQYCERLVEMERETMLANAQLEQIRSETYPGLDAAKAGSGMIPMAPPVLPPTLPPTPRQPAAPAAPPTTNTQYAMVPCPTCGEPVRARALYCNKCGTRLR